jgi:histone-lysine N-methyltransferase SETD3
MGKKQSGKSREKLSATKRNDLNNLVDQILVKSKEPTPNLDSEWKQYLELSEILERIRKIESEIKFPFRKVGERDDAIIDGFCEWCRGLGARFGKVQIRRMSGYDLGLVANESLTKSELFIEIPDRMIFSVDKVKLPKCLNTIPLFENMSHIHLAFTLLVEKLNTSSSPWKPYLEVLPEKYRTCLYFSPTDMQELKGTNALGSVLKQCKFIASQYAFLYKFIWRIPGEKVDDTVELLRKYFTYDLYW